jgi:uncharacterized protein YbgA (DUF1722 family)/uncharacterized protein YbbK (DUF523 family)
MKMGISSCLLGDRCRYDGSGIKETFIVDELTHYFDFVSFCPEAPLFGTPRDALRLVEKDGTIRVQKSTHGNDVTNQLQHQSQTLAKQAQEEALCGFILKSKSPSCGLERVKVYQSDKNAPAQKKGIGIFAQELKKVYPFLPIEEEGRLNDPWLKENFLMQVFAYSDLQNFLATQPTHHHLVTFHTTYKYLLMAKSDVAYKTLGAIVANHQHHPLAAVLSEYKNIFLKAISEKGTLNKTYNVLLHIVGYFKKSISQAENVHLHTACLEFKKGVIPLVAVTKLINLYVLRFDQNYLKQQKFLTPYPSELRLRSDIEAFK